jgi:hypothetical protein
MTHLISARAARVLLITLFAASACTTAGSFQSSTRSDHRVLVDGVAVTSHYENLLELLTARTGAIRFAGYTQAQPVIVMDGVRLMGSLSRLQDVRVTDVRSVRYVRPVDATFQFGGDASAGAIVIETTRGR